MLRIACLGESMLELAVGTSLPTVDGQFGYGGDTLNTTIYMARETARPGAQISYVTALGTDSLSEQMLAGWRSEGVDTSLVTRLPDALPGFYVIQTDAQVERTLVYWRAQAAGRRRLDEGRHETLQASLERYDLLYLTGITLAIFHDARRDKLLSLIEQCAQAGVAIAFDTNFRPRLWPDFDTAREAYARVGRVCRFALPGSDDELALFDDTDCQAILDRWHRYGAREVVLRCGAEPCWISTGDAVISVPAQAVPAPVDTTAAGDAFAAAYLVGRLTGSTTGTAAWRAHALGANVFGHRGEITRRPQPPATP